MSNYWPTSFLHLLAAAALQIGVGLATGNYWIGGIAAAAYYAGREIAQAEYRVIERFYGKRASMPWFGWVDARVWNIKSILDASLPFGGAVIIGVAASLIQ